MLQKCDDFILPAFVLSLCLTVNWNERCMLCDAYSAQNGAQDIAAALFQDRTSDIYLSESVDDFVCKSDLEVRAWFPLY